MSNLYNSKYPTILVDTKSNSVNDSLKKVLTIEEYYDLMHHNHNISNLEVNEGDISFDEMQNMMKSLNETINELRKTITAQQETISELTKNIEDIIEELKNVASISDWDVTIPGNQDANGNTLGTLMGFTMTEIQ